jgi:hypothetical protein
MKTVSISKSAFEIIKPYIEQFKETMYSQCYDTLKEAEEYAKAKIEIYKVFEIDDCYFDTIYIVKSGLSTTKGKFYCTFHSSTYTCDKIVKAFRIYD